MLAISLLILSYLFICSFAFIHARRRDTIFWSDYASPVFAVALWLSVTASGYGHQSLSHLVEIPIILLFSCLIFNSRIFVFDNLFGNPRCNSYFSLAIILVFVLVIRTFMPFIPE